VTFTLLLLRKAGASRFAVTHTARPRRRDAHTPAADFMGSTNQRQMRQSFETNDALPNIYMKY
ncbi:hypothetical protein EVAR_73107_1, partial [Eumeta japonica]